MATDILVVDQRPCQDAPSNANPSRRLASVDASRRRTRPSLTDRAYADLEEMIVTLKLAPGRAVSESELSQRLGIGRTPIREALQRLAREELVVILPRRGHPRLRDQREAASCACSRSAASWSG